LRGASEVKEHPWIKYYAWKDLYEKIIEAPFQHKIQEPWDAKYCNAPDKIGLETKERYDAIVKSDNYKNAFADYYFYFNAFDLNDKNNKQDLKILPNNHNKLQNGIVKEVKESQSNNGSGSNLNLGGNTGLGLQTNNLGLNNGSSSGNSNSGVTSGTNIGVSNSGNGLTYQASSSSIVKQSSQIIPNSNNLTNNQSGVMFKKIEGGGEIKGMSNIENKLSKIKQLSNQGSASSLLRQYRVSGISSYSGSGSNQNQVSNFSSMMSNNKSLVGSFISSNNSTSNSSNQNQNSGQYGNLMKKSGSSTYIGK